MKFLTLLTVTAGLLLWSSAVWSDPMLVRPRSFGLGTGVAAERSRWTLGLQATSWSMVDVADDDGLLWQADAKVRPVAVLEYELSDHLSIGGWYNPIAWDVRTLDPATGVSHAASRERGGLFEVYSTYSLEGGYAVQLAYQRIQSENTLKDAATVDPNNLHWFGLWGMKSFSFGPSEDAGLSLLLSAGISAPLSWETIGESQAATMLHGMAGVSYAFSPTFSVDCSAWALNATGKTRRTRFNAGVTRRF